MIELEQVTLENGTTYAIAKEINNYVYLVNPQNELDFCIRKNVNRNGEQYIEPLDSEEEFQKALLILKESEKE